MDGQSDRITVDLTVDEALLVVAALRQYEPFWPAALDDRGRADLLAGVRRDLEHVIASLALSASA